MLKNKSNYVFKILHSSQRVATQALCNWSFDGPCEHIAIADKE